MEEKTTCGVGWFQYEGYAPALSLIPISLGGLPKIQPRASGVAVPFSYLALLSSILPVLALRAIRRRRKLARAGLCPKCHYDLRAHAPGSNCPECGTVVARK